MNKRHAKPTSAQLLNRVYRQQIALRAQIESIASGQAMLSERMESFRVLADHCARLLREKETLMKMQKSAAWNGITPETAECIRSLGTGSLHNDYEILIQQYPNHENQLACCSFAGTHRPGIKCGICGVTP